LAYFSKKMLFALKTASFIVKLIGSTMRAMLAGLNYIHNIFLWFGKNREMAFFSFSLGVQNLASISFIKDAFDCRWAEP
jgi:hypothetical protein